MKSYPFLIPFIASCISGICIAQDAPELSAWRSNIDGTKGRSGNPSVHSSVSQFDADTTSTVHTPNHVFIDAEGIPSHEVGPWPGNPNMATGRNWTWRIPRNPQAAVNHTATPLGQIGTMVNGVPMFNTKDGRSYRNRGVWEQDAIYFEGQSMDVGLGHPQMSGDYHYHSYPRLLALQQGDSLRDHSPIIGFAFDGFPVYGAYGFANPDGTGGLKHIESGYRLRNISQRHSLPDGTQLGANDWGPDVTAQYPLGCYAQDFEYVPGLGELDEFNGRFGLTPEYPQGTYAYFAVIDVTGDPVYPYLIGPEYFGVLDSVNTGPGSGHITPPGHAIDYAPFRIYANDVEVGGTANISVGNATPNTVVFLAWSLQGAGPISTIWGDVALSAPFDFTGPLAADSSGLTSLQVAIPIRLSGRTIYAQALEDPLGMPTLSLPMRVVVR